MSYPKKGAATAPAIPAWMNIMFLDIETVPQIQNLNDLPTHTYELFRKKFQRDINEALDQLGGEGQGEALAERIEGVYRQKASLHAEFGKVVCITLGVFSGRAEDPASITLRLKTIKGRHEKAILEEAAKLLAKPTELCGHNGKGFDFPFLSRRYLANGLPIPYILNTMGKKPWDMPFIDTMELWAFGDFKYTVSLDMLASVFDLPSPKQGISGADVFNLYYQVGATPDALPFDGEDKIGAYCEGDVITLVNVYLKMTGRGFIIQPDKVVRVNATEPPKIEFQEKTA